MAEQQQHDDEQDEPEDYGVSKLSAYGLDVDELTRRVLRLLREDLEIACERVGYTRS